MVLPHLAVIGRVFLDGCRRHPGDCCNTIWLSVIHDVSIGWSTLQCGTWYQLVSCTGSHLCGRICMVSFIIWINLNHLLLPSAWNTELFRGTFNEETSIIYIILHKYLKACSQATPVFWLPKFWFPLPSVPHPSICSAAGVWWGEVLRVWSCGLRMVSESLGQRARYVSRPGPGKGKRCGLIDSPWRFWRGAKMMFVFAGWGFGAADC